MSISSRPTRPGLRPMPGAVGTPAPTATSAPVTSAPAAVTAPAGDHGQGHAEFEALRQRHQQLLGQRNRLELLTEQANKEVSACQRQAEAMGISSLEELQNRIQEMEAQDAQALAQFQERLKKEEELQQHALNRLAEIDNEEA